MLSSGLHYFPLTPAYLLVLLSLLGVLSGMAAARLLRYASTAMGVSFRTLLTILALSLLCSYVNIPIAYLPERQVTTAAAVSYFGVTYLIPVTREWPATMLAINVGGAVIPILLSLYLTVKHQLYGLNLLGVAIVGVVCYIIARPVPGLGIAVPVFAPVLTTAVAALALSRRHAASIAYVSGSLGTLIGADLLNLNKIQGLGAPIASIGGAGTFDGIFVTGLLAVVYASIATRYIRADASTR